MSTGDAAPPSPPQSALSSDEQKMIANFRAMDRVRQDHMLRMGLAIARGFPARARPRLRLIPGGAQ
jgi:hypothetical protein